MNKITYASNVNERKQSEEASTLGAFVFKSTFNRRLLIVCIVCLIIQFVIFKWLYPYPNLMMDSYDYIYAAFNDSDIAIRPIGYSRFLYFFSILSRSALGLVILQHVLLQTSIFLFLFVLMYILRPGKIVVTIMFAFAVLNPMWLLIDNYVAADSIFISLSLLWLSSLIWMLFRSNKKWMIIVHAFLLIVLFSFRYNAMFYPIVSAFAFFFSAYNFRWKVLGYVFSLLLLIFQIWNTGEKYKKLTGKWQMSAFGGWQIASNALYAYSHLERDIKAVSPEFENIHEEVRTFVDTLNEMRAEIDMAYFMWHGPLCTFSKANPENDRDSVFFQNFSRYADYYGSYGRYLIRQYPSQYFKYFILRNIQRYYMPPVEILGYYNTRKDTIEVLAQEWFGYRSRNVQVYSKDFGFSVLFPFFNALVNLVFLISIIGCIALNVFNSDRVLKRVIGIFFIYYIINMGFSILVSPIVLRYQLFLLIVVFLSSVLLVEKIVKKLILISVEQSNEVGKGN